LGSLQVRLICGKDIALESTILGKTVLRSSESFVIFTVGDISKKSSPSTRKSKNPTWDELFDFPYYKGDEKKLQIQVNAISNEVIGKEIIDFTDLRDDETATTWIHIHGVTETVVGSIYLAMTYIPIQSL